MTVRELIDLLAIMPLNSEVEYRDNDGVCTPIYGVLRESIKREHTGSDNMDVYETTEPIIYLE